MEALHFGVGVAGSMFDSLLNVFPFFLFLLLERKIHVDSIEQVKFRSR